MYSQVVFKGDYFYVDRNFMTMFNDARTESSLSLSSNGTYEFIVKKYYRVKNEKSYVMTENETGTWARWGDTLYLEGNKPRRFVFKREDKLVLLGNNNKLIPKIKLLRKQEEDSP